MLFNKNFADKEEEEELEKEENNELTDQDFIQINKEISKALYDMKKEKDDENYENFEEEEKELANFDIDFFSESSNSMSIDNNGEMSDNSFRSANVELNRNNLSFEIHDKIQNTITQSHIHSKNNGLNDQILSKNGKNSSSSSFGRYSFHGKNNFTNKTSSFCSMEKQRKYCRFNSNEENLNNSFNSSPYFHNFNNNLLKNNFSNKSNYINPDINFDNKNNNNFIDNINKEINMNNFVNNNNISKINNELNIQEKIKPILNNGMNNLNNINSMNNINNVNNINKINFIPNNNNININSPFINNINNNNYLNNNLLNNINMNILNCNTNQIMNNNNILNNMNNINQNYNIMMNNNNNISNINKLNNLNNINNNSQNQYFCSISEGNKNTHSNKENIDSPKNIIHIENILKSKDKRTTLIIRNIPNRYTISLLLQELNKNYYHKYDVVYLPQDYINNSNLGFGFINFLEHMYLIMFYEEFVGKKWNCFNSNKRCQLAYSKYQGKNELTKYIHKKLGISSHYNNNENLKKSFYINNDEKYPRPLIEIPIKYYKNFISYYPFSSCHKKNDKVFVVDKYYNF